MTRPVRFTLATALIAASALAGCASEPSRFQGISFSSAAHPPEVRALAQRAAEGDKAAQLELGIRFEEGRGVQASRRRAERLYWMAASYSGGGRELDFFRPMRPGGRWHANPLEGGRFEPGLPEAKARLEALRQRRANESERGNL
jgi:hypothetical protein